MKIAVLIPVYNDLKGLIVALNSIKTLDGYVVDVVVVDDGSPVPISLDDLRFDFNVVTLRLLNNSGIVSALNFGLEYILENGYDLIARLDAGDEMTSDRLGLQLGKFINNPKLMLLGGCAIYHRNHQPHFSMIVPLEYKDVKNYLWRNSCFCHSVVMFRVSVVSVVGLYSHDYPCAEDYEYFWRISKVFESENLPNVIGYVDNNPEGLSLKRRKLQLNTRLKIQRENFDFNNYRSWLGLITTILLIYMPTSYVQFFKKLRGKQ